MRAFVALFLAVLESKKCTVRKNITAAIAGLSLAAYVIRTNQGCIVAHFAGAPATTAWVAHRLTGTPFIVIGHADDIFGPEIDPLWARRLREASRVFAISEEGASLLTTVTGRQTSLHVMELPIRSTKRTRPSTSNVVTVGGLVAKKGHDTLLQALAFPDLSNVTLTLIGDGPERATLRRLATDLRLDARVRFVGAISEDAVAEHLTGAGCFVLLSRMMSDGRREGLPVAILEAVASQVPVVTTSAAGISGLSLKGPRIVPPDRPDLAASAIASALTIGLDASTALADRDIVVGRHGPGSGAASLIPELEQHVGI